MGGRTALKAIVAGKVCVPVACRDGPTCREPQCARRPSTSVVVAGADKRKATRRDYGRTENPNFKSKEWRTQMNSENTSIKTSGKIFSTWKPYLIAAVFVVAIASLLGYSREKSPATTATAQMTFATPAEAGQALQAAARSDDEKALTSILGPKSGPILSSG